MFVNRKRSRKKVLAVASWGGHWVQLIRLSPAFVDFEVVFAGGNSACAADVRGHKFYSFCENATRSNIIGLIRAALKLFWIVCRESPDVIISTGAAPGYIAIRIGKHLGARTVWLDSIANAEHLSMSGTIVGRYADLWLTQWPHLEKEDGPYFKGAVL